MNVKTLLQKFIILAFLHKHETKFKTKLSCSFKVVFIYTEVVLNETEKFFF